MRDYSPIIPRLLVDNIKGHAKIRVMETTCDTQLHAETTDEDRPMTTIYDNAGTISRADDRFMLEENNDGHLFETSNANTRELVCGAMVGASLPSRDGLVLQFGSESVADRYLVALQDLDK